MSPNKHGLVRNFNLFNSNMGPIFSGNYKVFNK